MDDMAVSVEGFPLAKLTDGSFAFFVSISGTGQT